MSENPWDAESLADLTRELPLDPGDGPTAFPEVRADGYRNGPSLLDHYAMAALTGLLAFPSDVQYSADVVAVKAYQIARAMLRHRG